MAAALGTWAFGATLVPLVWEVPPALRAGTVVRRLHGQLTPLGTGWTGIIQVKPGGASGPVPFEWSLGAVSTILIERSWRSVSVDLEPIACPDRRPQTVLVGGQDPAAARTLVLRPGFHWYRLLLGPAHVGGQITLSYRCVVVPASVHPSRADERPLAVAIGGLVVGGTTATPA